MRKCGCPLAEILQAGQWKSAAFMTYLDDSALDKVRLFAHGDNTSRHECCNLQDLALAAAIESEEEEFID